jgi:hypothetical protein
MQAFILKSKSKQRRTVKVWRDLSAGDITYAFTL